MACRRHQIELVLNEISWVDNLGQTIQYARWGWWSDFVVTVGVRGAIMGVRGARWSWACRRTGMIVDGNCLEGMSGAIRRAFGLLWSHRQFLCRRVKRVSAKNNLHRFR